jgi:hypothetical protein
MKLYIDLEHESTDDTMAYVHANRSFGPAPRVPLTDCYIYQRGKYILIEYNLQVQYWEHIGYYCYLEDALYYMRPDLPAKWKTLDRLLIFRQALRENTAQWMCLEDMLHENMSQKEFETFIGIARVYDKRHHGHETF